MKLVFSSLAVTELEAILHYIVIKNPDAAARVAARFDEVFDRIALYPDGAQELAQRPGVRRVPLVRYPYVIYYEQMEEVVMILRILHGAQVQPWSEEGS